MTTTLLEQMKTYKIFVDTCTFMHRGFQRAILENFREMHWLGYKFYTFPIVLAELRNISQNPHKDSDARNKALNALVIIEHLKELGLMEIVNVSYEGNGITADQMFLGYFVSNCNKENLQLITQDKDLTYDIGCVNGLKTYNGKAIRVTRYNDGKLEVII